ncbi:MAG: transcription-repair coupling factor [Burkholderiales bacterium]|nr:transcription-repair coupling factor [Burkholderiales bacterium]
MPSALNAKYASPIGSSDSLLFSRVAAQSKPLVIVTEKALDAHRLLDEIRYFAPNLEVGVFPDWETLPYDNFSPHQDLISERLATLYKVMKRSLDVVIVPTSTALYQLPPVEFLAAYTFFLEQKKTIDPAELRNQLTVAGYSNVSQVVSPGEYSFRGGLIDLFPMGSPLPYRIDLFDNEIDNIRTFDVDTQRSIYPVKEIKLLPAREFPLDEAGKSRFRRNFREKFEGDPSRIKLYKDVSNGLAPTGIEYYLPLFFEKTATLFDYLPEHATICLHQDVRGAIQDFWRETKSRHDLLHGNKLNPVLPPEELFLTFDAFFAAIHAFPRMEILGERAAAAIATSPLPPLQIERRADNPVFRLETFLEAFEGRILVLAESLGRREIMMDYFREYGLQPAPCESFAGFLSSDARFMMGSGPVLNGFDLTDESLALVTETELYALHSRTRVERKGKSLSDAVLRDLSEINPNDPVVHEQHGVGRYLGLIDLDLGDGKTEFLMIGYADDDKLYVPVSQLHLISRYNGTANEHAPLYKLGSGQWEKAKRKALEQVRDTAAELLNIYAQRAIRKGHRFDVRQHDLDAFAEGFGFDETPDQTEAIRAVIEDLRSEKPMDRLICGDVGFGKTEVALRAAFVAVMDGKQVALLVPTTLLAEQHFQNFSARFAQWPVRIAELSRFRSAKEQAEAMKGLREGKIDIIIGTHKLLQKDVSFDNLGLVIIDEEHRFGVRQKEQIKSLRAEIDVLTLTATPIPRTLAMSLEGLRDFSMIATAPARRLAIKTFICNYSEGIIREACSRELKRGGQIYFLHNQVETIEAMREKLEKLLPEARIDVAHGQMPERDLERIMRDFYHQRFNILLCTTIIETGIDVPTANTILINRADRFGLAQLHQLRGRIGRSHHQAYAYLLTPEEEALPPQAKKRLDAIRKMGELGAGFFLAMHDLEIRGAGELLGESQSGEMQKIGFSLYNAMLDAAVKSLQQGKEPDLANPLGVTTEINLHTPALLPQDYCEGIHERLVLYKRLASCDTLDEIDSLHQELVDRFGLLPLPAKALIDSHRLRILGNPLGILKIDASEAGILVQFLPDPPIDPGHIIRLVQNNRNYRFAGPDRLKIEGNFPDAESRIRMARSMIKSLQNQEAS